MKKALATIFFMIIITTVFIAALAFMNESTQARILRNSQINQYKSILYAFQIFPADFEARRLAPTSTTADIPWTNQAVLETMKARIKKLKLPITNEQKSLLTNSFLTWRDSVEIFVRLNETQAVEAYGFQLKGKGLWGTITAFGAVDSSLTKMLGIDFIEQVETPGLGARILEEEFKYFFRNLDLNGFHDPEKNQSAIIMIKNLGQSNLERSTNRLQAITGATQTCDGVLQMLNTDLSFYIAVLKANQQRIQQLLRVQLALNY